MNRGIIARVGLANSLEPSDDRLCFPRTNHRDDANTKQLGGSADERIGGRFRRSQQNILVAINFRTRGTKDGEPVSLRIQSPAKTRTHESDLQTAWSTVRPPEKPLAEPVVFPRRRCVQRSELCSLSDLLREPSLCPLGTATCVRWKGRKLVAHPGTLYARKQVIEKLAANLPGDGQPTGLVQHLPKLSLLKRHGPHGHETCPPKNDYKTNAEKPSATV